MKKLFLFLCTACLLLSCGEKYYVTDYKARLVANDGALAPFMALPKGISAQERDALQFLYAYMPVADVTDYPSGFYLENVRSSLQTRKEMGWDVPEREFRHFVLPLRVNNESLDSARVVFAQELKPRVQGLSMEDAILEVNHWCHEKVTYQPSDGRTSSPLNLVKNALGRCGEESTFCVTALRSVGIPARQVYTPRWAHTDDNHAWVEAWANGEWHFLGACEPEPVLDLGWFNAPASRAMLMHTKVFGKYDGPEEVVLESPNYTEVNLIDNYAQTARINFQVVWSPDAPNRDAGKPVEGARVDFCIYNYAEFYPAVSKYTDAEGRTFTSAGLGDMLVWASKGNSFGYTRVSFGKDTEATIVLRYYAGDKYASPVGVKEAFALVPPPENVQLPEVTPEQRTLNNQRTAREDSLRHAYEATFPTREEALAFVREHGYDDKMASYVFRARGNAEVIKTFLAQCTSPKAAEEILPTLSNKDLHDVTLPILFSYYTAKPFRGSRIENEFLSDYYTYFQSNPGSAATQNGITVIKDPTAWNIPMSPEAVWRTRLADPRSLDIYTVALLRARGQEARKNPVTGVVEVKENGAWKSLAAAPGKADPKGTLKLSFQPGKTIKNPQYYRHFTLSKIVDGRPQLLSFDEGELDMGGGASWAQVFPNGYPLDEGTYLLVSGNRLDDGSVNVAMNFFEIEAGKQTVAELKIEENREAVNVIGRFEADFPGRPASGYYVLALLEPGKEPTNHALRDLAAAREHLETWGRPIVLLCSSEEALARLRKEEREGRYGKLPTTAVFGVAPVGLLEGALPVVIVADGAGDVYFRSEGYTIGLGDQIATLAARL